MENTNTIKFLLLKVLNENGNIANLEKAGYQYAIIAQEYSRLINDGLIIINDQLDFVLSEAGKSELGKLENEFKRAGQWKIEPYVKFKVDQMDKYDIFIE